MCRKLYRAGAGWPRERFARRSVSHRSGDTVLLPGVKKNPGKPFEVRGVKRPKPGPKPGGRGSRRTRLTPPAA